MQEKKKQNRSKWRLKMHEIIFEADTPMGKAFDVAVLILILLSIIDVMLESVQSVQIKYGSELADLEMIFTVLFTIEYLLRLISVRKPMKYALSFYGVVDLLAILPTYLGFFIAGAESLLIIRAIRLLRVFRIFKLARFLGESKVILTALRDSRAKIIVFLLVVLTLCVVLGSVMYLVEGGGSGFTSIPRSMYWSIVTLTTVGYGDISPGTPLGQTIASFIMVLGYAIIAVPTGIVTNEIVNKKKTVTSQSCPACSREGHGPDADYCKYCGAELHPPH